METLQLPVCVDIASIAELHSRLAQRLQARQVTQLDGSLVRRADAAGLQVLSAFLVDARASGLHVDIVQPSAALLDAARLLGLRVLLGLAVPMGERRSM